MVKLLEKLKLKDFQRICIINSACDIVSDIQSVRPDILIDEQIDPRFLYNFLLIFVTSPEQIDELSNRAIHNLYEDGVLWFIYPKKRNGSNITRENGWNMLKYLGFKAVNHVAIDESWTGIRFRNSKFVRRKNIIG